MRLLVTGAAGLLGGRLAALLSSRYQVVATRHSAAPPSGMAVVDLDLLSPASIESALSSSGAEAVVHSAALADVDKCEAEPGLAEALNIRASETLGRLCRDGGLRLVALSTDLVFSGARADYTESELAAPLMTYGRTKLLGEQAVLDAAPGSVVVRIALVHGRGFGRRATASESIAWSLRSGRRVRLFTDQYRTPIDPESIASALQTLVESSATGVFHLGGPERLSRHELGLRVADELGLSTRLIDPARQAEHPLRPPRPADVSLDSSRARRELDFTPRPIEAGIREGRQARSIHQTSSRDG
jgi:dTDP-4-dehydrorhamnose reductase